ARANATGDVDGQALARPLVDNRQALQRLSIGARVKDEVVGPYVIGRPGRQWPWATDRHASAGAATRHLQPRLAPQAMRPVRAHDVPFPFQEDPNAPIADRK